MSWAQGLIADRARGLDASGIRRIFDLGAKLADPINLSIGQPDFPVPDAVKAAAIDAIESDLNGYTPTQGAHAIRESVTASLKRDLDWDVDGGDRSLLITSGTSGALVLAAMAMLNPGDRYVIGDPYFVLYPALASLTDARVDLCDTGDGLRLTAERVEPLLTERTKFVLHNSPSNPGGVVSTREECAELAELCRSRGVMLISDEIYDEFVFDESRTDVAAGDAAWTRPPSAARLGGDASDGVLLIRGFGKTYGLTGWRMGYAAGPTPLIEQMAKLQQFTYVCAPSIAQHACVACGDVDMSRHVAEYQARRDLVLERLSPVTSLPTPGGAFYAFVKVPEHLGMSGTAFAEAAIERNVLTIPGGVFSQRDDYIRLSFAAPRARLEAGLEIIADMMRG